MAAISTAILAFLQAGDHIVLQGDIYGGTYNLAMEQFNKFGIEYSFTDGLGISDFETLIKQNTKAIYVETPSNSLIEDHRLGDGFGFGQKARIDFHDR